ncbi:DNA repair helicase UVH6 [Auxenochlorella protothecoides]|uniref:DNA 5'-3' helicase n=1 Tax=Auxenochlorella protothecoides TaxID=3075 RepID=A0A087SFH7_AUXPR|nr:DNA repair helicase UVH6 [Auxenochlorella protothecoides]KFM24481.1 DNA repair helicase UVH6 [Auxenochlorella protothecoides]
MRFLLEGLTVYFPYEYIYPEQYKYMLELKHALDAKGHCLLEMPTGTGKTITLLSLITSYQLAHPETGKLIYCTRTVPEMEKVLAEVKDLIEYRSRYFTDAPAPKLLALGLSSRKNLCIHPRVAEEGSRESVDARCMRLTASWVRERARGAARPGAETTDAGAAAAVPAAVPDIELCEFFEGLEGAGADGRLDAGVYTMHDLRALGRKRRWCPYFLARHMVAYANVVVWNYQYLLDPKVAAMVSREMERECIVVFDEAHNIDNVCIEALSVELRQQGLDAAGRNVARLRSEIERVKSTDADRLKREYQRLVQGLASQGALRGGGESEQWLANPALPADILQEAVPGNIRRAEHFLAFLQRFLSFLRTRLNVNQVVSDTPTSFLTHLQSVVAIEGKTLRFCYDRLTSLMKTLEISATDDFGPIHRVADFATLVGTYTKGFAIIVEPYDERMPGVPDPVIQLACLDASLAIKPVFAKFQSVVITSGTLSPIDLYPRILDFKPVCLASLAMTLTRQCLCPVVLTRGGDQLPVSTKFDMRDDPAVTRNYGRMLLDLAAVVPDGIICFFVSYSYMDSIVSRWNDMGILSALMTHKLVFIETVDVVETTLALDNYRRACDCGRGAIFFSVARGKVAEGIDFDRHYGRCVVMFGVPYQYTLGRILRARLEYLRETFQIKESDFLAFDAVRQAAQCVGRVIRSKADYGLMVFADKRYQRHDKRDKLPGWISSQLRDAHLNLSTDMLLCIAREFMRAMAQPFDGGSAEGASLLSEAAVNALDTAGAGPMVLG